MNAYIINDATKNLVKKKSQKRIQNPGVAQSDNKFHCVLARNEWYDHNQLLPVLQDHPLYRLNSLSFKVLAKLIKKTV